ncbi:MAG TPA: hypothetical protein VGM07_14890 [Stellaceae bacterium]|jgi:hypothetical protein
MRRARPLPYFAEAPITTIVAVVVTVAAAIDGLVAIGEAGLPGPLRTLAALVVGVVAPLVVVYEIAGPAPVLIPALRRMFRRRP